MNNRGKVIIIPNEEQILQETFIRDVKLGESHTKYLQEFSDIYSLGYSFKLDDYQTAPCQIAEEGHLILKSEDSVSLMVLYLPLIVSNRQYNWLYQNLDKLEKYTQINAYSLQNVENKMCWSIVHGLKNIMLESSKKNLLKRKGMKK